MIRGTNNSVTRSTLYDIDHIAERLSQVQRRLSTGKQISQPEDDPFGAGRALFLRNEVGDIQQYQRNINDASSWVQTSDTALGNANDILQRVRELVVQASNGTQDPGGLAAIRSEIGQLKETLRGSANATFAGRYVFSGAKTEAAPYPAGSNTYAGNTLPVQRAISAGQTVQINQAGTAVFGADGSNVFDLLDTIQSDLAAGNRSTLGTADLTGLDTALDRVQSARSNAGAMANRLDTQLAQLKDQELNVNGLLSKTEDADMASTMITFSQTQSIYQAALQAGARVIQPSLLDFLH